MILMDEKEMLIRYWKDLRYLSDNKLFSAFRQVPREGFIIDGYRTHAYGDYPLPIVDHAESREIALERYTEARQAGANP